MRCSLCQKRPAKRSCPALRQDICSVCCGTKRQVEIACTPDCVFLETAHRHPAAVVRRQLDRDVGALMTTLGSVSEQQLQLFFILQSVVLRHKPTGLARLVDADLALAVGALATSLETASKGLIYDEATTSIVAEGLRRELKPVIEEITNSGGSRAEREVAAVLRGIERGAKHQAAGADDSETGYLERVARVIQQSPHPVPPPASGLIVAP